MLMYENIIKDGDKVLREKCDDVVFPLSEEDFSTLEMMDEYLVNGYDPKVCKKYNLRPGVGIAAPQVGVTKKMICIMAYDEKEEFHHYILVNPKIISYSMELAYLSSGEGCLSVENTYNGYIHRAKRIKVKSYSYNFKKKDFEYITLSFEGYLSIVFQHEYDHLQGILFYDHIDKINPYFVPDNSKPIEFNKE